MIRVAVNGALGRMGQTVCKAVFESQDLELCALIDPSFNSSEGLSSPYKAVQFSSLEQALKEAEFEVLVDFTRPDAVKENLKSALSAGIHCVLGTTGSSEEELKELHNQYAQKGARLFYAPNFTTGAVLMMCLSKVAAKFFPDVEIIEFHHNNKKDAPSGTAMRTAELIADQRAQSGLNLTQAAAPGKETELKEALGARGAEMNGIYIHAVRSNAYVAHQEVIFGSPGQSLTIRHDSIDREAYMPGVLLAIRNIKTQDEPVVVGLEKLMGL